MSRLCAERSPPLPLTYGPLAARSEGPAAEVPATAATTDAPKTETKDEVSEAASPLAPGPRSSLHAFKIKPKINRRLSARIGQYITKVIKKDHPAEAKPAAPVAGEGAETTEGAEAAKEDVAPVVGTANEQTTELS